MVAKTVVRRLGAIEKGVAQLRKTKKQPKRGVRVGRSKTAPKGSRMGSSHVHHFINAHADPTAPEAAGARQLSSYPVASAPFTLRPTFQCTSSAAGNFGMAITPHALYTAVIPAMNNGSVAGGSTVTDLAVPMGVAVSGAVDQVDLATRFERYKIVSAELTLRPTTSYTNTGGSMYVAVIPSGETFPALCATTATTSDFNAAIGIPIDGSGFLSAGVTNLPNGRTFNIPNLLAQGGLTIRIPITGPRHEDWLETSLESTTGPGLAFPTTNATTFGGVRAGSFFQTAGWGTILIRVSNVVGSAQFMTAQLVMHCEGVPRISTTGSNPLIATGIAPVPVTSPEVRHRAIAAVQSIPLVRTLEEKAKSTGASKLRAAMQKLGPAEKLMGLALL